MSLPTHPEETEMPNKYETADTNELLHLAEQVVVALRAAHPEGDAADYVEQMAARLSECTLVRALADEGIGQRPPITLLLEGKLNEETVYATLAAAQDLTLNGYIVLQHDPPLGVDDEDAESMAALLRQKIDLADVVNIVNVDGIDEALLPFIDYAETVSKPVQYTNPDA